MTKFIVKGAVKYGETVYGSGSVVEVKKEDVEEFKSYGWEIIEEDKKEEDKKDLSKLKNAELEALLTEKGIAFEKGAKKAELLALLKD